MPTSQEEAHKIVAILNDYLTVGQAKSLTQRLHQEVGEKTTNSSLQISLRMLKDLYEIPKENAVFKTKEAVPNRPYLWPALVGLIIVHYIVFFFNVAGFFVVPFMVNPFIAIPLMTFIMNLMFWNIKCPLTTLENYMRRKMGLPEIRTFMKHYILRPIEILTKKAK